MLFRPRWGCGRGGGDAHLREVRRLAARQQPQEDRQDCQRPVHQEVRPHRKGQ